MNAPVLITGATGFVGACLARRCLAEGYETHILARSGSNRWRIADLQGGLDEHDCDLRDAEGIRRLVADIRPRLVFHLATYGGFAFQQDTRAIYDANLIGTMNLLKACEQSGFDLFVNTGSSSEYGSKDLPMRESDLPEPVSDYGVSKAAATLYCQFEERMKGLPVLTLRLFSPYGPWDDPKRLIPFAAASLLEGRAPTLASPDAVRDYVFIDDVVDCYLQLIRNPSRRVAGIYNIGSGVQSSIGSVVEQIEAEAGTGATAVWGGRKIARPEPAVWVADVSKAREILGWSPQTPLSQGLAATVRWMKQNLQYYRSAE